MALNVNTKRLVYGVLSAATIIGGVVLVDQQLDI